jgi:hypothetical protein
MPGLSPSSATPCSVTVSRWVTPLVCLPLTCQVGGRGILHEVKVGGERD